MEQVHATCIDLGGKGVLLRGPSGSGKSDLALRLIDGGARLVADDRTDLTLRDNAVIATAPEKLTGKMEVRGLGIVSVDFLPETALALVADLIAPADVERMPEPAKVDLLGLSVALIRLAPFQASAPAKVRAALNSIAGV
ncbi:MAG: HPr kinase/phosphatase C-terminal domain-containing protein [Proteobacteria bacterium]|nr:HPr kinase/phosphatase C-terminal domain-containing protein [Pseudomonadota bacterium]MDA1022096.1 HPr kinase/phosphatase C-terminal domain-containing protein [Pseudomonadota bacterium]